MEKPQRPQMLAALKQFFTYYRNSAEVKLYPPLECKVRFRTYQSADREICRAIYAANEHGRFPEGSMAMFDTYLAQDAKALVVAEHEGRVVGFGGLHLEGEHGACLCFGMVHPEYQGRRIGTTLTLLRFAQLAGRPRGVVALIFAVESSMPYYARFGFTPHPARWLGCDGKSYPIGMVHLPESSLQKIKATLERRGIRIDGKLVIPRAENPACQIEAKTLGRFVVKIGLADEKADGPGKPAERA